MPSRRRGAAPGRVSAWMGHHGPWEGAVTDRWVARMRPLRPRGRDEGGRCDRGRQCPSLLRSPHRVTWMGPRSSPMHPGLCGVGHRTGPTGLLSPAGRGSVRLVSESSEQAHGVVRGSGAQGRQEVDPGSPG